MFSKIGKILFDGETNVEHALDQSWTADAPFGTLARCASNLDVAGKNLTDVCNSVRKKAAKVKTSPICPAQIGGLFCQEASLPRMAEQLPKLNKPGSASP
jgi:hypothetical protein